MIAQQKQPRTTSNCDVRADNTAAVFALTGAMIDHDRWTNIDAQYDHLSNQ